ncbi:hypothetical protein Moror_948 [Moniliophthora roreri MCA 2997]|uniref:BTB domain-containing protein n=2 Tax=Moniliophthora roreri TaxID=221103 RepID=V2YZR5_MONRO|nr:hypothetical protein Moror_948 [Moniliophthora roreri MCA 2997]KAI3619401.1 hypothetical protein WG66_012910 [Moniliophthora roreri]
MSAINTSTTDNDPSRCHVKNCLSPVDIVLRSCDGQLFGTHTKNLETFSEGFPPSAWADTTRVEIVDLSERGPVLRLLLGFMHNASFPELDRVLLKDILELDIASRKYGCVHASEACRNILKKRGMKGYEAVDILRHKHKISDNTDIEDIARGGARYTKSSVDPNAFRLQEDALARSSPMLYDSWIRYKIAWQRWNHDFENNMHGTRFDYHHFAPSWEDKWCPTLEEVAWSMYMIISEIGDFPTLELFERALSLCEAMGKELWDCELEDCEAPEDWPKKMRQHFSEEPRWADFL